jgi:hypothetical protein
MDLREPVEERETAALAKAQSDCRPSLDGRAKLDRTVTVRVIITPLPFLYRRESIVR